MAKVIEMDPHGKAQHEAGAKLDAGKPMAGLVMGHFSGALMKINAFMSQKKVSDFTQLKDEELIQKGIESYMQGVEKEELLIKAAVSFMVLLERRQNLEFGKLAILNLGPEERFGPFFMLWVGKALEEVSKVGTYGAQKYTPNGWKHVENGVNRYFDAGWRHVLKLGRQTVDPETGCEELGHIIWNALAVLQLKTTE